MYCNLQAYHLDVNTSCKDDLCALLKSCSALNETYVTFLLDTKNIHHIVQKTVYDIAKFHLDRWLILKNRHYAPLRHNNGVIYEFNDLLNSE